MWPVGRVMLLQGRCSDLARANYGRALLRYTFTFDSEQEKATLLAYAKERGLTLAGLLKMLIKDELERTPPKK